MPKRVTDPRDMRAGWVTQPDIHSRLFRCRPSPLYCAPTIAYAQTGNSMPQPPSPPPPPRGGPPAGPGGPGVLAPQPARPFYKGAWFVVLAGALVLLIGVGIGGAGGSTSTA